MADFVDVSRSKVDLTQAELAGKMHLLKSFSRTVGQFTDTVKVELYDAQAALVQLGRAHKLFVDKSEITGANNAPISIVTIQAIKPDGT
jgi:hypothetical protein